MPLRPPSLRKYILSEGVYWSSASHRICPRNLQILLLPIELKPNPFRRMTGGRLWGTKSFPSNEGRACQLASAQLHICIMLSVCQIMRLSLSELLMMCLALSRCMTDSRRLGTTLASSHQLPNERN